jgi:CarboxypepD_reg-like domain/TonB-dependent Receptor Plug Domain
MKLKLLFKSKTISALGLFFVLQNASFGQMFAYAKQQNAKAEVRSTNISLKEGLSNLKSHYNIDILFEDNIVKGLTIPANSINFNSKIEQNLETILKPLSLNFKKVKVGSYLIVNLNKALKSAEVGMGDVANNVQYATNLQSFGNTEAESAKQIVLLQGITGRISDSQSGESLPGVSIVVKGTKLGTTSDASGNYKINVPDGNSTLVFSYVGYLSQSVEVGNSDVLNVKMILDSKSLSEVAVIGSRSANARTNTQSAVPIDVISPKELKGFSQVDVGQILNYVAPSFNSNRQTVADGTDHVDPASLRGLGPDQVLVLVNGKRRHLGIDEHKWYSWPWFSWY